MPLLYNKGIKTNVNIFSDNLSGKLRKNKIVSTNNANEAARSSFQASNRLAPEDSLPLYMVGV